MLRDGWCSNSKSICVPLWIHDAVVAGLGWPEKVSVGEAKIDPDEWFSWRDEDKVVDFKEKGVCGSLWKCPRCVAYEVFKIQGWLWPFVMRRWEQKNWKDRIGWKGKEIKLSYTSGRRYLWNYLKTHPRSTRRTGKWHWSKNDKGKRDLKMFQTH